MKEYYCERTDTLDPEFPHYKCTATNAEEAVNFFRQKHGNKLEVVYDEDFSIIYTNEV